VKTINRVLLFVDLLQFTFFPQSCTERRNKAAFLLTELVGKEIYDNGILL
jgi:hypothetical protein